MANLRHEECVVCMTPLQGRQTKFCSVDCKNKYHQCYPAQKQRGLTRKLKLVQTLGGKCLICGYKNNLAALAFHHLNSDDKVFKLDMRSLSNRKLEFVLLEIEKCVLLCHNCHAEVHNPQLDLDRFANVK